MNKLLDENDNLELIAKSENALVDTGEINLGITNGSVPSDFYSRNPCTIGYSYIRFEVDGKIRPCCIAKYEIGDLKDGDWRVSWHSTAWMTFRKKLTRIHIEKFHLTETDWLFCQQCSHLPSNMRNLDAIKGIK